MGYTVTVFPDDLIYPSVVGDYLSHGTTVASYFASITGHWGTSAETATGYAQATFVSKADSSDSFTYRWTLTSNTGVSRTVRSPTVTGLNALDNIGEYYLQNFTWNTTGQYGVRQYFSSVNYTAAQNAGSVSLNPDLTNQGIYQYNVNYTSEGTTSRFMVVDPTATSGVTKNYSITGVQASDLSTPLTGLLTFSGVSAYLNITANLDNASDAETIYINVDGFAPYAVPLNNVAALVPSHPVFDVDSGPYQNLTNNGNIQFNIPTLASGMSWSYSIDGGVNWIDGDLSSGSKLISLPDGNYSENSIIVRTVDSNGFVSESVPNGLQLAHIVDQTKPNSVVLNLQTNSGDGFDYITNNGRINLVGIEPSASWIYSTDGSSWLSGSGTAIDLTGDGFKSLRIKQIDLAGNSSDISTLDFTLDSTVQRPVISLQNDSGDFIDRVTSNSRINISGIEDGATWSYSLNGVNWLPGAGVSLDLVNDGYKTVQIKQTDLAGNISEVANLEFTLDTTVQPPALNLQEDTGNASDRITRNGRVSVSGIEDNANWLYSLDGLNWLPGTSSSIELIGDGIKSIRIKQIDLAGNVSDISILNVTLDSIVLPLVPILQEDSGIPSDLITRNGRINVSGLETGASWFYSIDGTSWLSGSGSSLDIIDSGSRTVRLKQVDVAGNVSEVSSISFALDSTIQSVTATLENDTGNSSDGITSNGRVNLNGLEPGSSWYYSLNGVNWIIGSGSWLDLSGDGPKSLQFKQVDIAGNTSAIKNFDFILDTRAVDDMLSISQVQHGYTGILSGYASPNSFVKISIEGSIFSQIADSSNGAWSIDLFSLPNVSGEALPRTQGSYVLAKVVVEDAAGNESEAVYRTIRPHLNSTPIGTIAIETYTGGFKSGDTLVATSNLMDPDGMDNQSISFKWQADGVDIANAGPSRYYQVRESDVGKTIRAIGSYVDYTGVYEQIVSLPSEIIKNHNRPPTGSIIIENLRDKDQPFTLFRDETLVAKHTLNDLDGLGTIGYQWYVDGVLVEGVVTDHYTPSQYEANHSIQVVASYIDKSGTRESVASNLASIYFTTQSSVVQSSQVYSFPTSSIQSIGFSPDGKNLLIKIGGVTSIVSSESHLGFAGETLTSAELSSQFTPIPVFQSTGGVSGYALPEPYAGPASLNLQYQLIETADNAVVIGGTTNDFIKVASTNSIGKAVNGGGGTDVIDGGVGSTFVSGGTNHSGSTFFLDGRAPGTSWSTITDFRLGNDKATIWGWKPGVSKVSTIFTDFNTGGADGFKGLTLHFENLLPDDASLGQTNTNLNSITLSYLTLNQFGASDLADLNAQIAAGTNSHFQVNSVTDAYGEHGYLFFS